MEQKIHQSDAENIAPNECVADASVCAEKKRVWCGCCQFWKSLITPRSLLTGALWLIFIGGLVIRLWQVWHYNPVDHIFSDPQRHWDHAKGTLMSSPLVLTDPILYQVFVSFIQKFSLGDRLLVFYVTALLTVLCPWVWYRFFRELFRSKIMAQIGGIIIAWTPSWIAIYSYLMQETLFLPFLGCALWMTWRAQRKKTLSTYLWMVVLWLLTALTRGVAIPLAAAACIWVWAVHPRKVLTGVWSAAILAFVLVPLAWRTHHFLGQWYPHGSSTFNEIYAASGARLIRINYNRDGAVWYYIFQSPAVGTNPLSPLVKDWRSKREGEISIFVDIKKGHASWAEAKEKHQKTWAETWPIRKENLIYLGFAESWPDNNKEQYWARLNSQLRWIWVPLAVIGFLGCLLYARRLGRDSLLPVLFAIWLLFQGFMLLAVNEGRYRKPAEGLAIAMVLLAGERALRCKRKTPKQAPLPESEPQVDKSLPV